MLESVVQVIKAVLDTSGVVETLIGIGVFLAGWLAFIFGDLIKSAKLLTRMHAGSSRGRFWAVASTLGRLAIAGNIFDKEQRKSYFTRARMRVEHEIFEPKPIFRWPLPEDDDDYGKDEYAPANKKGKANAKKRHADKMKEWRGAIDSIFKDQVIKAETAGDVNDNFTDIKRYFDILQAPSFGVKEMKFISPIHIDRGFVAPLHLLAGLLIKFNAKWEPILRSFNLDTKDYASLRLDDHVAPADRGHSQLSSDARQIQSFIYNCWLLWGPSISLCDEHCKSWQGAYISLQYGYGDENNSIEIVGERRTMMEKMAALAPANPNGPMAFNAQVEGILQLSSLVDKRFKKEEASRLLTESWSGMQDERPILYITERAEQDRIGDAGSRKRRPFAGDIRKIGGASLSNYYSAYLWVIFVVLKDDGELLTNKHKNLDMDPNGRMSAKPWLDFVPFFEHGNIADAETLAFMKSQLAEKAASGLARLVAKHGAKPFPLKFAYACAIDDSGCGHPPLFPTMNGGDRIVDLIKARLNLPNNAQYTKMPSMLSEAQQRLVAENIVDFGKYGPGDFDHPHASCTLPLHINRHYRKMDEEKAKAEAEKADA